MAKELQTKTGIRNIIFDLGGVIMNLHPERTLERFKQWGLETGETSMKIFQHALNTRFDVGGISAARFRDVIRKGLLQKVSDQEFDDAWNAMLGEIPARRMEAIVAISKEYNIYLLSNINEIHLITLDQYVADHFQMRRFSDLFIKAYYSNIIQRRKPDQETFAFVLEDSQLKPEETLFIDDLEINIQGAQSLGIQTHHLTHQDELADFLQTLRSEQN